MREVESELFASVISCIQDEVINEVESKVDTKIKKEIYKDMWMWLYKNLKEEVIFKIGVLERPVPIEAGYYTIGDGI